MFTAGPDFAFVDVPNEREILIDEVYRLQQVLKSILENDNVSVIHGLAASALVVSESVVYFDET